ncbi:MAG TPA: vWA domain-containing protein, partial [Polyangia bacterium]|nr:vWA domain-containing protein [Polyangia bacterium]
LLGSVLVLAAWAASAMPHKRAVLQSNDNLTVDANKPQPQQTVQIPQKAPRVELVFALDTTGSMSGLIDGAKRKIWSIAQFIANGQPKPDVRIGLVAYRDIGDAYVTRFYDLSDDLDEVFAHLSSFEAGGGGDTPEHVSKALFEAVNKTSWNRDQSTLKQIYLVGDAPPHTDYNDGYDYNKIAKQAHDLGIHINTIRCGGDRETEVVWNRIASESSGEYASIDQSGGVQVAMTPYDAKLAELNARLVGTSIGYGDAKRREMHTAKAHAAVAMPAPAAADRASFYGAKGGGGLGGKDEARDDLVEGMATGSVAVAAVPTASLPEPMQKMDAPAREAYVKSKLEERTKVQAEINALAKERNGWLHKNVADKPDSFDAKVEGSLKKQAKSIGLKL